MRYMLSVLIVIFAAGCAETGGQRRDLVAEGYHKELQRIQALRPHARYLLPESLTDREVTLLIQFMTYRADIRCRIISKYRKAAEILGCIIPEATSKAALLYARPAAAGGTPIEGKSHKGLFPNLPSGGCGRKGAFPCSA